MKKITHMMMALALFFAGATPALAHVSVKPNQVGIGAFQTFSVGVPVERDVPTIGVRLVIPEGLEHVSPNVKPGWKIAITHAKTEGVSEEDAEHTEEVVTEIEWTGGVIPQGQRDDFFFSAKAPGELGSLVWKAYQTYQDGTTVSWELEPEVAQPTDSEGKPDYSQFGPASTTTVVNDLTGPASKVSLLPETVYGMDTTQLLGLVGVLLGGVSLGLHLSQGKSKRRK